MNSPNRAWEHESLRHATRCTLAVLVLALLASFTGGCCKHQPCWTPTPIPPTATVGATPAPSPTAVPIPVEQVTLLATYDSQGQLLQVTDGAGWSVADPKLIARVPSFLPQTHTGIPLSRVAAALSELTLLEGAIYDQASGQLILFGQHDPAKPALNPDDLIVAFSSVYSDQDPWLSIDPGPSTKEMIVTTSDSIVDTHFGLVMFEADRLMKVLGLGKDNITEEPASSSVPGYQNMIDLSLALKEAVSEEESRHRFWIEVGRMRLALSKDRQAATFRENSLVVNTEYLGTDYRPVPGASPDPAAETFAAHMTQYYDEYADERPAFGEVTTLAQLVSLAKWTMHAGIPVDVAWLEEQGVTPVLMPSSTPAITVSGQRQDGTTTHTVSMYGGVSFKFENEYESADGDEEAFWNQILADRSSSAVLDWESEIEGRQYRAIAISPAQTPVVGGYLGSAVEDLELPGEPTLRLSRRYNSTNLEPGLLSQGWVIDVSHIKFPSHKHEYSFDEGKTWAEVYSEVIWINPISGQQVQYQLVGQYSDGRIVYQSAELGYTSELLLIDDGIYILERPGEPNREFDENGQLLVQHETDGDIRYVYIDDQLSSIIRADGANIEFLYDAQGRIEEARASTGQARGYIYDDHGDLSYVIDTEGNILAAYGYDQWHRLVLEQDGQGNLLQWNAYDDLNRLESWGDVYGHYRVNLGADTSTVAYVSSEGPILSLGALPSDAFLQRPGVQTFLSEAGNTFLPDLGAYERLLNDDMSLLYIAHSGERVHILLDGQYVQVEETALADRAVLKEAILRAGTPLADRLILVIGKASQNQDIQSLFMDHVVLYAEALDTAMITGNLHDISQTGRPTPESTGFHLATPRGEKELENIGGNKNDWLYWAPITPLWEKLVRDAGFPLASRDAPMDQQIWESLNDKDNVVIVIAHSDGKRIYLPDGTQLTPGEWDQTLEGRPLVILISCETGKVVDGPSLAKQLLDKGAKAVVAPIIEVPANDDALLYYLLELSQQETDVEEDKFLRIWLQVIREMQSSEGIDATFFHIFIGKSFNSTLEYC